MDPFDLIGKRIQDLSDLYDNDGPSAVDQGSRPMFANGQLVQPNADGLRPGYKGTRISFTEKEVKQINTDLPKGIKLTKEIRAGEPYYYWRLNKSYKDKTIAKNKAVTDKDFTKDIGLKTLKKDLNGFIEINLPNALTQEKYEKLRYDNENLTQEDFLKKLNSEGYTTVQGHKFSRSNVNSLDSSIGLKRMKSYSLKEQTQFLKNTINGSEELRDINKLPISKVDKENRIRKLANSIRSRDNRNNTLGSFAFTDSKEAKLWKNFFSASRGDRIEIGGTFEGKDLSQRKNWPRDKDGKVNWGKKGPDGKPAWKYATFTDTQTPKGDVTFTFDNLKNQVEETFGSGYFDSSTSPYTEQKQSYKNLEGKKLAENRIKEEYYKKYNKYPSDGYVSQRMRPYAPAQVHHYGENGIMGDPYKVQLVSRSANQSLGKAEMTYKADLKKAQGNPVKINEIKNNFINKINNISNEMGGIKFTFEGQQYGSESTPQAAYDFEKQDLDKLTTKNSEAKAKILENIDKNKFRRVSTVLVNSAKEGGFGEAIQKICMRKKAKKGGRMF